MRAVAGSVTAALLLLACADSSTPLTAVRATVDTDTDLTHTNRVCRLDFDPASADVVDVDTPEILVDFLDAGDPCAALRPIVGDDPATITVVVGGMIRDTAPDQQKIGIACGGYSADCEQWETPAFVAVNALELSGDDIDMVVAHELGHVFGLRHDGDEPCEDDIIPGTLMAVTEMGDLVDGAVLSDSENAHVAAVLAELKARR